MKKSLVTKVVKFDKKDSYNNCSYLIEFANADKGFYSTKDENQNKFVSGRDSEYEIEEKIGKNDKPWFKISLPGEKQAWTGKAKPVIDPRAQFIGFCHAYAKDLVVADKCDIVALNNVAKEMFENMIKLYNTIK